MANGFNRISDEELDMLEQTIPEASETNPLAQYDLAFPYDISTPQADEMGVTDYIRRNEDVPERQDLSALANLVRTAAPERANLDSPKPKERQIEDLPGVSSDNFKEYMSMNAGVAPTISRDTPNVNRQLADQVGKPVSGVMPDQLTLPSEVAGLDAIGSDLPEMGEPQSEPQASRADELYKKYLELMENKPKDDMSQAEADRRRAFIGSMIARIGGTLGEAMSSRYGGNYKANHGIADSIMKYGDEGYKIAQDRSKAAASERQNQLKQYLDLIKDQRDLDNTRFNQDLSLRRQELAERGDERSQLTHELSTNKAIMENELSMQLNDPNSDISAIARQRASKALKSPVPENVSAAQLKTLGFDKAVDSLAAERLELSRQRLEATREDMERKTRQGDARLKLGEDRLDFSRVEKYGKDARDALKDMRATETFKSAERQLTTIPEIKLLLEDSYNRGGQSLAMLGPKVARGIAGEVGVLTDQDVTRYVKNPSIAGGLLDTLAKVKSGQITKVSYDNLQRLLDISAQSAQDKMNQAIDREAELLSRREKMPFEEARYLLDNEYKNTRMNSAKYKAVPGSIIKVKGKEYRVGADGDTLEEIK